MKTDFGTALLWRLFVGVLKSPVVTIREMIKKQFFAEAAFFVFLAVAIGTTMQMFFTPFEAARTAVMSGVGWFIISGVLFVVGRVCGGTGSYRQTLTGVGATYVATIVVGLILTFLLQVISDPFIIITSMLVFLAWFFVLLAIAVKEAHKLSRMRTFFASLPLIGFYVLAAYFFWGLIR